MLLNTKNDSWPNVSHHVVDVCHSFKPITVYYEGEWTIQNCQMLPRMFHVLQHFVFSLLVFQAPGSEEPITHHFPNTNGRKEGDLYS